MVLLHTNLGFNDHCVSSKNEIVTHILVLFELQHKRRFIEEVLEILDSCLAYCLILLGIMLFRCGLLLLLWRRGWESFCQYSFSNDAVIITKHLFGFTFWQSEERRKLQELLGQHHHYRTQQNKLLAVVLGGCISTSLQCVEDARRKRKQINIPLLDQLLQNLCKGISWAVTIISGFAKRGVTSYCLFF